MFKALKLDKSDDAVTAAIVDIDESELPDGDVTVDVEFSTINYKDGLAITGSPGVVRTWPMVPGIDLAGVVAESSTPTTRPATGWCSTAGASARATGAGWPRRPASTGDWLVPLPEAFTTEQAMAIGTAGYTAMLCVQALEAHGVSPERGPVIVTGAAGGVGSTAVAILAGLGYEVAASTGRPDGGRLPPSARARARSSTGPS